MSTFFKATEAAQRYQKYRPKIHARIIEEIRPQLGDLPKASALDIACGTGDSSAALRAIAHHVVGTDISEPMLQLAAQHCDKVVHLGAEQLPELQQQFDLISVCMAFHWFDQERVIPAIKKVTSDGGFWLIYNFGFKGQANCPNFKKRFQSYLEKYPTPARHNRSAADGLEGDAEIRPINTLEGSIDMHMEPHALIGYLSTQSNVEASVIAGKSYAQAEADLHEIFQTLEYQTPFRFHYTVELYQYNAKALSLSCSAL